MATVDLPAKAMILNVKQFNGKHGCTNCEYEGIPRPSAKMIRDWPYREDCMKERTHSSMIQYARQSVKEKAVVSFFFCCIH